VSKHFSYATARTAAEPGNIPFLPAHKPDDRPLVELLVEQIPANVTGNFTIRLGHKDDSTSHVGRFQGTTPGQRLPADQSGDPSDTRLGLVKHALPDCCRREAAQHLFDITAGHDQSHQYPGNCRPNIA
jgi:hypothetical protein